MTDAVQAQPGLMIVSSLYPTTDRPEVGPFVARRVAALRGRGVTVRVIAASNYREGAVVRHARMVWRAFAAPGPLLGVESHVLFPAGLIGAVIARRHRVPHVTYAHGADVMVSSKRSWIHRRLAAFVARSASAVVTNSTFTSTYIEAMGVRPQVIPPGVDLAQFSPGSRAAARARTGLPSDGLIALYVGQFSLRKGADVFAKAVALAPDWRGVMVGSGDQLDLIAAADPTIILPGPVPPEDIVWWLRSADVVVVPSRVEPLGLAPIEALSCGIPVVASDIGGLAETVIDDHNGFRVPPADPRAIADALVRLSDADVRGRLAAAARLSVARHAIERVTGEMSAVWLNLGVEL